MTDPQTQAPQAPRNLPALLTALRAQGFTGAVTVHGPAAGVLHLRQGLISAVVTPGAPSAEARLLRSRRISEDDWTAARATAAGAGGLGPALTGAGLLSAAELAVLCTDTVHDGAFAMALAKPDGWQIDEHALPPELAADPGIEPARLTDTVAARLALLTRQWGPPALRPHQGRPLLAARPPGVPGRRPLPRHPAQRRRPAHPARHRLHPGAGTVRGAARPRPDEGAATAPAADRRSRRPGRRRRPALGPDHCRARAAREHAAAAPHPGGSARRGSARRDGGRRAAAGHAGLLGELRGLWTTAPPAGSGGDQRPAAGEPS
ncbi:hypothetical protein GXW82_04360 [Streptacidiphilus sp. 4-A2]|nr:hypothetical protein [Streptacidiphilus sp. 4-A2]